MYDHARQDRIGVKVRVSKLGYIIVYKVGSMQPEGGPGWTDPSSTQVPHSAGNKHSYHLTTLLPHYHQYDATEQHKLPPSARLYSKSSRGVSRVLVQHAHCGLGLCTTNAGPILYPSESRVTGYPSATCPPQNQSCACSLSTCFSKSAPSRAA